MRGHRPRSGSGAARDRREVRRLHRPRCPKAWSCSTPSTRSRPTQANDLACRWNCKAGKCGSCSAEINGKPRLMCMTRLNDLDPVDAGHRRADAGVPADPRPGDRRVVELPRQDADQEVQAAQARRAGRHLADGAGGRRPRAGVPQVHRVLPVPGRVPRPARPPDHEEFIGPRFFVYTAALEMHPLDTEDRVPELKQAQGIGYCNITKCCTKVCPEQITITDNAIIPLKERVVDRYYDPLKRLFRMFRAIERKRDAMPLTAQIALQGRHPPGPGQGRALPAAQRAGGGREHLPGHPGGRAGQPAGAGDAAARAHGPVRPRIQDGGGSAQPSDRPAPRSIRAGVLRGHRGRAPRRGGSGSGCPGVALHRP